MQLIGSTGIMQKSAWNPIDAWNSMTDGGGWRGLFRSGELTMSELAEQAAKGGEGSDAWKKLQGIQQYRSSGLWDMWHNATTSDADRNRLKLMAAKNPDSDAAAQYHSIMAARGQGAKLDPSILGGGVEDKTLSTPSMAKLFSAPAPAEDTVAAAPEAKTNIPTPVAPTSPVVPNAPPASLQPSAVPPMLQRPAEMQGQIAQAQQPAPRTAPQLTPQQTAQNAERAQGINPATHLPMGFDPRAPQSTPAPNAPEDVQRRMQAASADYQLGGRFNPAANLKKTACANLSFRLLGI